MRNIRIRTNISNQDRYVSLWVRDCLREQLVWRDSIMDNIKEPILRYTERNLLWSMARIYS